MDHIYERAREAADFLQEHHIPTTKTALILGTGLDLFLSDIEVVYEIPYHQIPHFARSTVESHRGSFIYGIWNKQPILILAGRMHYYEGYSLQQITFPIRLLKFMKVENLVLTNAAGALNPEFHTGDLVIIKDHINLMPDSPLRGPNDERLGVRFLDMSETYDKYFIEIAQSVFLNNTLPPHKGVYASLPGPNLETPAEYNYLHRIGADLVGMSTVPEVIVARHSGLKVLAISIVSNECYPIERIRYTTQQSVIESVHSSTDKLKNALHQIISQIAVQSKD